MAAQAALPAIAERIWKQKYRLIGPDGAPVEQNLSETWQRVARAAASVEKKRARDRHEATFFEAMDGLEFLPAGRIIAGAGTGRAVTLLNCFVMGRLGDDLSSIFEAVKEAALTMQQGGGIGQDFSTLRPRGAEVRSIGADASGPTSFMDVWDAMCRTIMSAGQRRGAMMATLDAGHPDIETFIDAKSDPRRLRNFNLSVLASDAFMASVRRGEAWPLTFGGKAFRTVDAPALWERLMRATYDYAEPGVVFIDRVNQRNNLAYCETIAATNPCGEQPLPPYGACLLGSLNLARLVTHPFSREARIDLARLEALTRIAIRFLDNIIDVSRYPLAAQLKEARAKRRIGLGITGLADALAMCGIAYGEPRATATAAGWMAAIQRSAYEASAELAAERRAFPLFEPAPFLASPNVQALPAATRAAIGRHGIRNGCLTSIAPTGTISLLAGNVSSGIEPIFDLSYRRRLRQDREGEEEVDVVDYAVAAFRREHGEATRLPRSFVTAGDLTPRQHLEMQAALQPHVDSAISKTINCPAAIVFDEFKSVYVEAYELGLKGCTTFRPNAVTGSVLARISDPQQAAQRPPPADGSVLSGPAATAAPAPVAEPGSLVQGHGAPPVASVPDPAGQPALSEEGRQRGVVYISAPLAREEVLTGSTYKLRWPGSDHAIYITINDIERNGRRRPFEIFINTKNLEHYAWTVALTRMISAVFRRGGDVSFVVEELEAIFDPQGGQWLEGRYVPSLIAAIGGIIDRHLRRIGALEPAQGGPLLQEPQHAAIPRPVSAGGGGAESPPGAPPLGVTALASRSIDLPAQQTAASGSVSTAGLEPAPAFRRLRRCPACRSGDVVMEGGCWVCRACGESRCG